MVVFSITFGYVLSYVFISVLLPFIVLYLLLISDVFCEVELGGGAHRRIFINLCLICPRASVAGLL